MEKLNTTQKRLLEQSENILRDKENGASIAFLMRKYKFSRKTLLTFLKSH